MNKKILRQETLAKRGQLSNKELIEYSAAIANKLYEMDEYKQAKRIMTYVSTSKEVNTHSIIQQAVSQDKSVVVPICVPETRHMLVSELYKLTELEVGFFDLLEPKEEFVRLVEPETIDLVLVPGVLFARNGYRIGYGGGYYDRFLSKLDKNVVKIGLTFHLQTTDLVPTDSYDIPVDIIITEKEIINCSGK